MKKRDELKNESSCLNRADLDEPIFVLLGRDIAAPGAIRAWAATRVTASKNKPSDPQIVSALALACDMEEWRTK